MSSIQRTEIPISKSKIYLMLFFSVVFVAIGVAMFFIQPSSGRYLINVPVIRYGLAVACILFFGYTGIFFISRLKGDKPGLIIDEYGITDCSSSVNAGLIPWADIRQFTVVNVMNQKFLMIVVHNPNDYINKQTNALKRRAMIYNHSNYGSPISISANTLKIKLPQLQILLEECLEKARAGRG